MFKYKCFLNIYNETFNKPTHLINIYFQTFGNVSLETIKKHFLNVSFETFVS